MVEVKNILVRNYLNRKSEPSLAFPIVLLTLLVCYWFSYIFWTHSFGEYLAANPQKVFIEDEYWRLFTSTLIHGDFEHFISNTFMLGIMGYFVTYHYGAWVFPLLGFFSGAFINLIVLLTYPPEVSLVGASGVVYWLWGFWLFLYIKIQRHIPLLRRFMKITVVGLFVLLPTEFKSQTSYLAHAIGLLIGVLCGAVYFYLNSKRIFAHEIWEDRVEYIDDDLAQEALEFKQD